MRTGRLSISRGYGTQDRPAAAPRLVVVPREPEPVRTRPEPAAPAAAALTPEYRPAHDRLAALERLARLRKQGVVTPDEFAFEKARILAYPAGELVLEQPAPEPRPAGPSLLGRLLSWKFIPVGLALGLGLSFLSQPHDTVRFFDEALRLLGA
ncbi:MAG TPA: SHOCT domain-containing protein [Allosphingosinicella sp.]|jgi:hypothetical protein|nr:SHOCT domain-containing protein [Allosphingosinicella sp.]